MLILQQLQRRFILPGSLYEHQKSRSCTCRGKSFSQPDPRLFAALREDEAYKHQLKVSIHSKEMRNVQVRAQKICKEAQVCSEGNNFASSKCTVPSAEVGQQFCIFSLCWGSNSHSILPQPLSLHCLLPHFNFPPFAAYLVNISELKTVICSVFIRELIRGE